MQTVQTPVLRHLMGMLFAILVSMFACPGTAHAVVIFSDNFESPSTGGDASFTVGTPPAGWAIGTGAALMIMQNPDNGTYTGTTGVSATIANMNGPQIVGFFADGTFANGIGSISSPTITTLTLDHIYTATVSIGRRGLQNTANLSLGYVFELLAGSTVIASASDTTGSTLTNNAFTVFSISHTAISSDPIGQPLTILLGTNLASLNTQRATDFDAVSLSDTVPEPASLSLIGLTSVALLRRRRRRRA